jgi:hypothetical protein
MTKRTFALSSTILAALCLPACQTTLPELVELYDMAAPDGMIELELERDGSIREIEADIPIEALPENIKQAALDRAPGAQITGAEREFQGSTRTWEVKLVHEGRAWEFVIDEEGAIRETEKELRPEEAPAAVLQGADLAMPQGIRKSVEEIRRGDVVEYHVKKDQGGASYKIVLDAEGKVTRHVREHRAEIEIPLAR